MSLDDELRKIAEKTDGGKIEVDLTQTEAKDFMAARTLQGLGDLRVHAGAKIDVALERIVPIVAERVTARTQRWMTLIAGIVTATGSVLVYFAKETNVARGEERKAKITAAASKAVKAEVPSITTELQLVLSKNIAIAVREELAVTRRELESKLTVVITDAVRKSIEEDFQGGANYQQLAYLAFSLDLKTGFTATERDTALGLLSTLKSNEQVLAKPDFPSVLEKIVDSFVAADQWQAVDEIFDAYTDICLRTQGLYVTLLEHYGERLVGNIGPAAGWPQKMVERFRKVSDAASTGLPGGTLAYEILIEFRQAGEQRSKRGTALWDSAPLLRVRQDNVPLGIRALTDPRVRLAGILLTNTDTRFLAAQETPQTSQMVKTGVAMLDAYEVEFGRMLNALEKDGIDVESILSTFARALQYLNDSAEARGVLEAARTRINKAMEAAIKADEKPDPKPGDDNSGTP